MFRILDRYQDEQSATERERDGDVSSFPTHPADEGTDTFTRGRGVARGAGYGGAARDRRRARAYIAIPNGSGVPSERWALPSSRGSTHPWARRTCDLGAALRPIVLRDFPSHYIVFGVGDDDDLTVRRDNPRSLLLG